MYLQPVCCEPADTYRCGCPARQPPGAKACLACPCTRRSPLGTVQISSHPRLAHRARSRLIPHSRPVPSRLSAPLGGRPAHPWPSRTAPSVRSLIASYSAIHCSSAGHPVIQIHIIVVERETVQIRLVSGEGSWGKKDELRRDRVYRPVWLARIMV